MNKIQIEGFIMENIKNALIGKVVMSVRGVRIGVIIDSLVDNTSGQILSVSVKPSEEMNFQNFKVNEHGEIIIPYASLKTIKNVIIAEDSLI